MGTNNDRSSNLIQFFWDGGGKGGNYYNPFFLEYVCWDFVIEEKG